MCADCAGRITTFAAMLPSSLETQREEPPLTRRPTVRTTVTLTCTAVTMTTSRTALRMRGWFSVSRAR